MMRVGATARSTDCVASESDGSAPFGERPGARGLAPGTALPSSAAPFGNDDRPGNRPGKAWSCSARSIGASRQGPNEAGSPEGLGKVVLTNFTVARTPSLPPRTCPETVTSWDGVGSFERLRFTSPVPAVIVPSRSK